MAPVPGNIQKKALKLKKEIEYHNKKYYVDASPEISDFDFDMMMNALIELEEKYPALKTKDSPTQRVGGEPLKEFAAVRHKTPMLSLDNTYSPEDLVEFDKRISKVTRGYTYTVELKIDGVAVALSYKSGYLELGATRGDGVSGDDITHNIKTIGVIPLKIDGPGEFEARGRFTFQKMNSAG